MEEENMPFKCALCGLSFETPDEFTNHKLAHQKQLEKQEGPERKGLICLRCGKPIPTDSYEPNYKGVVTCHGCKETMKVILLNGEVEFAMSQGVTEQTGEDLLKQYSKRVLEYAKARDLVDSLMPVRAALSENETIPTIKVTEDLMARFQYAETTMVAALRQIRQIHEQLYRL